jgi:hypothetical protein
MLQMAPWFGTQGPEINLYLGEEGGESERLHPYALWRDSAGFDLEQALMSVFKFVHAGKASVRYPSRVC